jgi:hypothetical protein
MSFFEWVKREWHVVEGHAKWDFYRWLFTLSAALVVGLGAYLVHKLRYAPDWLPYAVAFALALFVFFWMGSRLTASLASPEPIQSAKPISGPKLDPREPDLRTHIREILFRLKRLPISNDIFVLLRVSAVNHGESDTMKIKLEGKTTLVLPSNFRSCREALLHFE